MFACFVSTFLPQFSALFAEFEWDFLMIPLLWVGIFVLTIIIESQTADLVAIWFVPSALIALILSFLKVQFWVQFGVFVGVTVLGLILSFAWIRPMMKRRNKVEKTNADALAGKQAHVEEDIRNDAPSGVVKINGQLWTARMEDPATTAAKGGWVVIVRVEGAKLICRPVL